MRAQKWKIAAIVLALVAGGAGYTLADVAATVDPAAVTLMRSDPLFSVGWRFLVKKEITITHLGLYDAGDNGLVNQHVMGIWRVKKEGGLRLERWEVIGPGGVTENHHVYVALREPLNIVPDPVPGAGGYERWLVGVWNPANSVDGLTLQPTSAATFPIVQVGIIQFENYTGKSWALYPDTSVIDVGMNSPVPAASNWVPWGQTSTSDYFGVNFKYTVPPTANAGPDKQVYTSEQAITVIGGIATHTIPGTAMDYRWLEGGAVLKDWVPVGDAGAAGLNLGALDQPLPIGVHALTLEVRDATYTSSDTMQLTVSNTPPEAQPAPTHQAVGIDRDAILVTAEVADFDGDLITYQWLKNGELLGSGTQTPPAGGDAVSIGDLVIAAGDAGFPLGTHEIQLAISDGVNPVVTQAVTVFVGTAPTIAPTPSTAMLWPPNQTLWPVTIWANALSYSGGPVTLAATVQSNEPDDGSAEVDCSVEPVDDATGVILLQLRAERSGTGQGRVYTVNITATDSAGIQSYANVEIRVPHDRRKN